MTRPDTLSLAGRTSGRLLRPVVGREAGLLVCVHGGGCNGGYFDIAGWSLAEPALERGLHVLLVDRPGHGGSAAADSNRPVDEAAEVISAFVDTVLDSHFSPSTPVAMLGHSIGGAVVLTIAARAPDWRLRAIAISGIGDRPTADVRDWIGTATPQTAVPTPPAAFFFGPEGTYDWRAALALRRVAEPWRVEEVRDIVEQWPRRLPAIAQSVAVPVHWRLAQNERIWQVDDATIDRIAAQLANAPEFDVGVMPGGGHLYEIHRNGPELVRGQLDFLCRHVSDGTKAAG